MTKFLTLLLVFGLFGVLAFRPIPQDVPEEELLEHAGVVKELRLAGTNDALLVFENSPITFYVNRAFMNGSTPETVTALVGQEVTVKYPSYWTLLDPKGLHKAVLILDVNGNRAYNADRKGQSG